MSIGNILSCDGHAKLVDLEYAKKMDDQKSHNARTASDSPISLSGKSLIVSQQGTMHFMSIEVAVQSFLFKPPPSSNATAVDQWRMAKKIGEAWGPTEVLFFHNHLHDLESLWWVAVWVVFYNHFSPSGDQFTLRDAEDQLKKARILFPPMVGSTTRRDAFQGSELFKKACDLLHPNKKSVYLGLKILREQLIKHYNAVEKELPLSIRLEFSEDDIYDDFAGLFLNLKEDSPDLMLDFIPGIYTKLYKESKRPRSESTNDPGVAPKTLKM